MPISPPEGYDHLMCGLDGVLMGAMSDGCLTFSYHFYVPVTHTVHLLYGDEELDQFLRSSLISFTASFRNPHVII